jgi:RNA polymerase sigma-70 factor (ECF subfamily)
MSKHLSEFHLDNSDDQSTELFETMDLDLLLKKIQALPNGYRVVFNLHGMEGYTHREIAKELGITEGTSKSQFSRARKILQEMVKTELKYEQIAARYVK